eukprot:CAMPEP_0168559180 /NCGR_PEP_ID=MMETSP0413-20121227/10380_1 /TAXON_ID=136452 /ORGANISM="Filamoeba nolandi, Strain NC-AS-23-1" /LENGTH=450 /DNA_ID=CAMNT_0008590379 /DNA_START=95 /DNA_END=1443 /DNA_ORIENTATION=+
MVSVWQTQSIASTQEYTPTIQIQQSIRDIKEEEQTTKPPSGVVPSPPSTVTTTSKAPIRAASKSPVSKGPSRTPSVTPTPFTIFIPSSLHGTRKVERTEKYLDTTINTPLQVHLEDLFEEWILEAPLFKVHNPSHGILISNENDARNITYVPNPWFSGKDSFEIEATRLVDGMSVEWKGIVNIRIRTGVVLNQPLLLVPPSYNFSEANLYANNEIKKVLKNFQNSSLFPQEDSWLNRRYNRCAIVGNGGSLRGSKRGAEIDSHDVVVRLNLAPFLNFSEDVGSRLDIAVSNGPSFTNCWRRNDTDLPGKPNYEILAQISFKPQWVRLPSCQVHNNNIKYLPMSYLFVDLVDQVLNEYQLSYFGNSTKKYRSTGMLAVTAMSFICDHVSAYGFERGAHMENHYYSNVSDREWNGHSYMAEKKFFSDLANGSGLFEKHFELYNLFSSFSYIV